MFKAPFSFDGRIRRTEFGISFIIYFAITFIMSGITSSVSGSELLGFLFIPALWFLWAQGVSCNLK